jgi:hypothetical protein
MKPLYQEYASVEPGGYGHVGNTTAREISPALKPSSQAFESMRITAAPPQIRSASYKL